MTKSVLSARCRDHVVRIVGLMSFSEDDRVAI